VVYIDAPAEGSATTVTRGLWQTIGECARCGLSSEKLGKEDLILRSVSRVLVRVLRDTTVPAGMIPPLEAGTVEDIHRCLVLIEKRQCELVQASGQTHPAAGDDSGEQVYAGEASDSAGSSDEEGQR
jgi:hypothetical protein